MLITHVNMSALAPAFVMVDLRAYITEAQCAQALGAKTLAAPVIIGGASANMGYLYGAK